MSKSQNDPKRKSEQGQQQEEKLASPLVPLLWLLLPLIAALLYGVFGG
jgi:hypothetical protein